MGLLSGFYFLFLLKLVYTITTSFQHMHALPLSPCPPYFRHIGFVTCACAIPAWAQEKKSLFLSWTLRKFVQTKLKWKLDKTESIEQCKAISCHACRLYFTMQGTGQFLGFHLMSPKFKLRNYSFFWVSTFMWYYSTLIQTNFRFKRVLCFAIQDAWISGLLCDAVFSWRPGKLLCGLKTLLILEILLSKHSLFQNKINITLIFMSSSSEEFTQ